MDKEARSNVVALVLACQSGAFALESVAHLRGLENELLPIAERMRKWCDKVEQWLDDNELPF